MVRGSATTDGQFAYFTPLASNSLYQYEYSTENWTDLPPCPYYNSGLAIIDSELTTVGGGWHSRAVYAKELFTLQQGKWVEKYPPMNTACESPAVVSTSDGDYLIVIGGDDGHPGIKGGDDCWISTVQLFQVKTKRWYKLTDLPQPLLKPSATICGDQLNVIGNDNVNGYSCSLLALPSSDRPITSPLTLSWKPLPRLPVIGSTAATLHKQLVLVGGRVGISPINFILQLIGGDWAIIGSMGDNRCQCLVASPSHDKLIIVGGSGAGDSVEECAVV